MPGTVAASAEANRATFADYMFARASWSLGVSFRCQVVWQFDEALPTEAVEQLRAGLSKGPLNRVIVRPRVLGARPTWARSTVPGDLVISEGAVARTDRQQWFQEQLATARLDVEHGPGWGLSMAATEEGGTLLSLVWLHAVADGMGELLAVRAALAGTDIGCLPVDEAGPPSLWDDVKDAFARLWTVLVGLAQVLVFLLIRARQAKPAPEQPRAARPPAPGESGVFQPTSTALQFHRDEWSQAATTRGGTENTLAVALGGQLARATGCVVGTGVVPVDLSVSERDLASGDARANLLASATVLTKPIDTSGADLSETRKATKLALAQLQDKDRKILESVLQIAYFAPTWLLRRMVAAAPPPPCVVSNIGVVPPDLLRIGGRTASTYIPRVEWFNVPEDAWRKLPPAMGAFFASTPEAVFIIVQHSSPASPLSPEELQEIVVAESARFGLKPTPVW
ncbi:MAG: hypothetical protein ACRC20_04495 [Segniliparus sp.]|uniref:hypothetical protein n=1 Tax=Segniliparus sp. TaxID=2804064 RepID=UPI003F305E13